MGRKSRKDQAKDWAKIGQESTKVWTKMGKIGIQMKKAKIG